MSVTASRAPRRSTRSHTRVITSVSAATIDCARGEGLRRSRRIRSSGRRERGAYDWRREPRAGSLRTPFRERWLVSPRDAEHGSLKPRHRENHRRDGDHSREHGAGANDHACSITRTCRARRAGSPMAIRVRTAAQRADLAAGDGETGQQGQQSETGRRRRECQRRDDGGGRAWTSTCFGSRPASSAVYSKAEARRPDSPA